MSLALTLAALAAIPGRAKFLPRVLSSLRNQVDVLCVYLNGWDSVPRCVTDLADQHVVDRENRGAERKLHWAQSHSGIYLSCDDDFAYPPDYVATMRSAVERWQGRAIITAHGRTYSGTAKNFLDTVRGSVGTVYSTVPTGRWVNHGGTGVMGWDTRVVHMPSEWPERNLADMQVALWAQQNCIPIWLIPHRAQWLHALAVSDPNGLFRRSQTDRHRRRTQALHRTVWRLFQVAA